MMLAEKNERIGYRIYNVIGKRLTYEYGSSDTSMAGPCGFCGAEAKLKCQGCRGMVYCSAEHQKKHWKLHKSECRAYEVITDDQMGRCVAATRDIPAGMLIFAETPLCVGPKWSVESQTSVPCVGCFTSVPLGRAACPRCRWPACSMNCPGLTHPELHSIECGVLSLAQLDEQNANRSLLDRYHSDALTPLKCLMLQKKNPKRWRRLISLEAHDEKRKGTEFYDEAETRIVSYLQCNYLQLLRTIEAQQGQQLLENTDSSMLHKICGILEVNAHTIELPTEAIGGGVDEVCGLYPTGCLLEHSCLPNCYYTFDVEQSFQIAFFAGRAIKKGEHLSIMYTHVLWDTTMRREHLLATKYFACNCERCADKTELGTYLSACKCIGFDNNSCDGLIMPVDPLLPTTDWSCSKCPGLLSADQFHHFLSQIGAEVDEVAAEANVPKIERLIAKLDRILHPEHYHMFALKHSLIQQLGRAPGYTADDLSDTTVERKIRMCRELLQVVDKLDPFSIRLPIYTGIILFELAEAIKLLKQRHPKSPCLVGANSDPVKLLHRAVKVLETERRTVQGRQLYETVATVLRSH